MKGDKKTITSHKIKPIVAELELALSDNAPAITLSTTLHPVHQANGLAWLSGKLLTKESSAVVGSLDLNSIPLEHLELEKSAGRPRKDGKSLAVLMAWSFVWGEAKTPLLGWVDGEVCTKNLIKTGCSEGKKVRDFRVKACKQYGIEIKKDLIRVKTTYPNGGGPSPCSIMFPTPQYCKLDDGALVIAGEFFVWHEGLDEGLKCFKLGRVELREPNSSFDVDTLSEGGRPKIIVFY